MTQKKEKSKNHWLFGFLYETKSFQVITLLELALFCIGLGCGIMLFSKESGYIVFSLSLILVVYKFVAAYQRRPQK